MIQRNCSTLQTEHVNIQRLCLRLLTYLLIITHGTRKHPQLMWRCLQIITVRSPAAWVLCSDIMENCNVMGDAGTI